jgi:cytochrome P450
MEAEIAIAALLGRFPNLTLATKKLTWQKGMTFRGVKALPVRW